MLHSSCINVVFNLHQLEYTFKCCTEILIFAPKCIFDCHPGIVIWYVSITKEVYIFFYQATGFGTSEMKFFFISSIKIEESIGFENIFNFRYLM